MLRLEMNFYSQDQRRVRLSLNDADPNLTPEQVKTAMESLIAENVFDFVDIHSARFVTTTVEDIPLEG